MGRGPVKGSWRIAFISGLQRPICCFCEMVWEYVAGAQEFGFTGNRPVLTPSRSMGVNMATSWKLMRGRVGGRLGWEADLC